MSEDVAQDDHGMILPAPPPPRPEGMDFVSRQIYIHTTE